MVRSRLNIHLFFKKKTDLQFLLETSTTATYYSYNRREDPRNIPNQKYTRHQRTRLYHICDLIHHIDGCRQRSLEKNATGDDKR